MSANRDLVIGIDSSTTATKAIAWQRDGALAAVGRSAIPLDSPGKDLYEQDPREWWRSCCDALRELWRQIDAERVAALAISNQRETFVPLDDGGDAVRPAIVWLDQRCAQEVGWLTAKVGAAEIHRITGKPPDTAPVAYRIAWMLRHEPDLFRRTALFTDVHGYLAGRLTGEYRTSWASADPLGLFDMVRKCWSPEVLGALDLTPDRLPALAAPGTPIGAVSASAAGATGLPAGTPLIAGGGDGQAAGLGVNALCPGRAYLNLGTAVVSGVYSREYRTGTAWRTMGSCSGEGCYFETSLRAGTFLVDWFARHIAHSNDFAQLEAEAAAVPAGSNGLLTLPYWGAVMTPYWNSDARGCFVGMSASHRTGELYRSVLEGIAMEQSLVTGMIEEETGVAVAELVAIGGGAASDLWRRILADVTGKAVLRSATVEASSLGAAMCAAAGCGWYADPATASRAMCGSITRQTVPRDAEYPRYRELFAIYRDLYPQLRGVFARLAAFSR